ncbi:MAG: Nif3-like dinuclear metal center hexameric protein [Oscillospiraceae bacterium]|jgi:dinuclear metal center YbgI/SA1388 family protein
MNVQDIYGYIDHIAPFSTQLDYDNAGLLMGSGVAEVERVLVTLDVTFEVAKEAARKKCQLIVSHHPLIFHGLKSVTPGDPTGAVVLELARRNIALISAHTNWDQAAGGVSDVLLERLGIASAGFLEPAGETSEGTPYGMGAVGELEAPMPPKEFARAVRTALHARGARVVLGDRPVKKVAVCGGAGGDLLARAAAWGADAYVTADVKYHEFLEAHQRGITLIDGGHFATEDPAMDVLCQRLQNAFAKDGVEFFRSRRHKEVYFAL